MSRSPAVQITLLKEGSGTRPVECSIPRPMTEGTTRFGGLALDAAKQVLEKRYQGLYLKTLRLGLTWPLEVVSSQVLKPGQADRRNTLQSHIRDCAQIRQSAANSELQYVLPGTLVARGVGYVLLGTHRISRGKDGLYEELIGGGMRVWHVTLDELRVLHQAQRNKADVSAQAIHLSDLEERLLGVGFDHPTAPELRQEIAAQSRAIPEIANIPQPVTPTEAVHLLQPTLNGMLAL